LLQDKIYIKTLVGAIGKNSIKTTRTETCFCLYEEGSSEAAMGGGGEARSALFNELICLTGRVQATRPKYTRYLLNCNYAIKILKNTKRIDESTAQRDIKRNGRNCKP
jgi:hypothetical protein